MSVMNSTKRTSMGNQPSGGMSASGNKFNKIYFKNEAGADVQALDVNPVSGKLTVYDIVNGDEVFRTDFGSVGSNQYVFYEALGGVKYRKPDGSHIDALRASPTGSGNSVAFGNYHEINWLLSGVQGMYNARKTGVDKNTLYNETTTNIVTDRIFSFNPTLTSSGLIEQIRAYLAVPVAEEFSTAVRISAYKKSNGNLLFENISVIEWEAVGLEDTKKLLRYGATLITVPAGGTFLDITMPSDLALTPASDGTVDAYVKIETQTNIDVLGISKDDLKIDMSWAEGVAEKIATEPWINTNTYRIVDSTTELADMVIENREDILISNLTQDIELTLGENVNRFSVRDLGEFIKPYTVKIVLSTHVSITLDRKCDYVTVFHTGTEWAYYDHRLQASFTISNIPDHALIGG